MGADACIYAQASGLRDELPVRRRGARQAAL